MRLPIYSFDSNPSVDRPVCHKSKAYCSQLVADGLAQWLYNMSGVRSLPLDSPKFKPKGTDESLPSSGAHGEINESECVGNATGTADRGKRKLFAAEMRAMNKVRNYGPASWQDRVVTIPL